MSNTNIFMMPDVFPGKQKAMQQSQQSDKHMKIWARWNC